MSFGIMSEVLKEIRALRARVPDLSAAPPLVSPNRLPISLSLPLTPSQMRRSLHILGQVIVGLRNLPTIRPRASLPAPSLFRLDTHPSTGEDPSPPLSVNTFVIRQTGES